MHTVWQDRYFRRYFSAFTIGNIGDWVAFFALQLYVVHTWHGSALAVSALFFAYLLPGAVLAPFFGVWVDRLSPTWLWSITDLISGVLTVFIIFAPRLSSLLGLLLIRSVSVAYNDPTMQRILKCLVSGRAITLCFWYYQYGISTMPYCEAHVRSFICCLVVNSVMFMD